MKKIIGLILILLLAFSLVACGSEESSESTASESASASETETPSETETAEPSETEDEDRLAPDGVWETDGERVTIEDDTVTIDYIDEDGNVTETYWVGSFELDEDSDTWTSTRDPEAEMTCESDTIEFTWTGTDNVYDSLSYSVTNEDGTQKTVTLERTESLGEVAEGVVPDFSGSDDADVSNSASASDSGKTSDKSDTSSAQTSTDTKTSDSGSASANTDASTQTSASTNGSTAAGNTGSSDSGSSSGGSTGSSGSSSGSGSSSSGSSGSSSSSGNSSSSGSGSSSSGTTACSHNYVGNVTKAATCSTAGVKTYTCSKCGASYTESIAATGSHNWQPVYKTVHHDATGHYETVTVSEAYTYGRYVCNGCGYYVDVLGISEEEAGDKIMVHCVREGKSWTNKSIYVPAVTEQQWVVDSNAYDEQVVSYYQCSVCGATK